MLKNWGFLVAEIGGLLAVAAILTFVVCWFVWGRSAIRANIPRLKQAEDDLATARSALTQSRAEVQRSERKQEELKQRLAREHAKLTELKKKTEIKVTPVGLAKENALNFINERRTGDTPEAAVIDKVSEVSSSVSEFMRNKYNAFFK